MVPSSLYIGLSFLGILKQNPREMGICASSTEIHDDSFGIENAVLYANIENGSQGMAGGSIYSHAGSKGLNQDSAILYQGYGIEDGVFCAVFDGHGQNGHIVSTIVRNRLPSLLLSQTSSIAKYNMTGSDESWPSKKWKKACVSAFQVMDKEIKILDGFDTSCSGTTAAVVIKQGEDLIIANLGDSRVVLGSRNQDGIAAVQLTTDFKPGVACEAERIRKHKGRVVALKEESHVLRVWLPHDDSPGLAMSRAFGDFVLKKYGIIAIPDVSHHRLSPNDEFVVVATDGVWDVMSNEKVTSIVSSAGSEEEAAKVVVEEAMASWNLKFPNSKRDDCTAICLFFKRTTNPLHP